MLEKCHNFLYIFDLLGPSPQLFILKETRYKSFLSSILSLIIVLFSIIYAIFSLNEYFKYNNPNIVYSKGNDEKTKRKINIRDTLLMFQFVDSTSLNTIRNSIAYFEANYYEIFDNSTINTIPLDIEICEFGKNVDNKYKDFIRDKTKFQKSLEDFYCISHKNENLAIFYYPNIGYSSIHLNFILNNNDNYTPEKLQTLVVSETDLINHNDKEKPIDNNFNYHLSSGFSSLEFTTINYNFQYIKYESDDGFFFKNYMILNGMSFSDLTFYKNIQDDYDLVKNFQNLNKSRIGTMRFEINKSYYDSYQRTYQKIPSLLAEIMSVLNLVFGIGTQIIKILCNKKMSTDIIEILLNKKKIGNKNIKNLYDNENKQIYSERKNITSHFFDETYSRDKLGKKNEIKLNNIKESKIEDINQLNINNNGMKNINYYHILKSYLCFKDNKSKLINLCHNTIIENMSVERILERFYNLDNINNFFIKDETVKFNYIKNNSSKETNKYNYDLLKESENKIISNKYSRKHYHTTKE